MTDGDYPRLKTPADHLEEALTAAGLQDSAEAREIVRKLVADTVAAHLALKRLIRSARGKRRTLLATDVVETARDVAHEEFD